jgi:hypothetical protein
MKNIDFLEHGGGHFCVRHHGELIPLPDPRGMHFQEVLAALALGHAPKTPGDLKEWQRVLVFERWCAAWDLPDFRNAQRLAYLVDHYRPAIASDLHTHAHVDLGELWRARRWTLLLDIIDRLPAHSWYASSVSTDEDHAKMMAESIAARRESGENTDASGPSLTTWTPEVAALTNVLDAVRQVSYAVMASQHGKKAGEPPKPAPRPVTPLERALKRAEFDRRKSSHQSLVARLLPHKSGVKP